MNETFETVLGSLKKYNPESNPEIPKIVIAGNNFLEIAHKIKKFSQFILGIKEYCSSEKFKFDKFIADLEIETGRRPFYFIYDDKEVLDQVIRDFEDYFDIKPGPGLFQRIGHSGKPGELQYSLVIHVIENTYYSF